MVRQEADWKNQSRRILDWFYVFVASALLMLYLFLWAGEGSRVFIGLAFVFAIWLIIYFTAYWQPILYLIMAIVVLIVTGFWFWIGVWDQLWIQLGMLLNLAFFLLCVYLFLYEERMA